MNEVFFLQAFVLGEAIMLLIAGYLLVDGIRIINRQTKMLELANELIGDLKTVVAAQEQRLIDQEFMLEERGIRKVTDVSALPPEAQAALREGLLKTLDLLRKRDN
jgi:hypothetical protein